MYVTVDLKDGFGNQMFMVAAMLGYAERHGHQPIFLKTPERSKDHTDSVLNISDFFPDIPVRADLTALYWTVLQEPPGAAMTYLELPAVPGPVLLRGYFQSERYFPTQGLPRAPPLCNLSSELLAHDWSHTYFLHIRRGDYMHPANIHHRIDIRQYVSRCLHQFPKDWVCFVVSDDIPWCKATLPTWFTERWFFCPETATDAETFFWMTVCAGGICANSSFSWWAAYFLKYQQSFSVLCMPYPWGTPPLPEARDLIPRWATRVTWLEPKN